MPEKNEPDGPEPSAANPPAMHVAAVLVASARALNNALDDLGFPETDDRIVELDGKLGVVTCSHERDSDDLFALIAELSSRGETWELQFRIDVSPTRSIFHTLSRHQPISAVEEEIQPRPEEQEGTGTRPPAHDLDSDAGLSAFRNAVRRVKAAEVFAEIGSNRDGKATAWIVQRSPRRVLAEATAADEPTLRSTLREVIPAVMFSVSRPTVD
ncbi:MAG TPA: hypothetical protein VKS60_03775 [Stellaceae bacterium]|nr:hypothetical protein [Stellaceae bacterium]